MQAAQMTRYGSPAVLQIGEVMAPTAGAKDVLISVHASAVTQGDRRLRAADFPGLAWLPGRLMFGVLGPRYPIPGSTFAGRVAAVGAEVTRFSVGDDVMGECLHGAYAEQLAMPATGALAPMPSGLSHVEAATLPYGMHSAYHFLYRTALLQAGERLVIIGAAGGVGRYGVQLAVHIGAHVTAICSARDQEFVATLGAHALLAPSELASGWKGPPVDVVLDTSGTARFEQWRAHLSSRGRFVTSDMSANVLWHMLRTARKEGPSAAMGMAQSSAESLQEVATQVEAGALRPIVAKTFPLTALADAHTYLEQERPKGDVVVQIASAP